MAITDEARNRLFNTLREKLGDEDAATMMELLPPVGWADVATKRDLEHLADVMKRDVEKLGADLRAEWRRDLLQQTFALLAANTTLLAIAVTVAKLT